MNRFNLAGMIILLALMTMGCQPYKPTSIPTMTPSKPETENPDIRGKITSIFNIDGKSTGIYIEGTKDADTTYDKAIVGIRDDTTIYINLNGEFTETDASHLEVGQTVEAWFTGPINTSYPVQAHALEIVILK